MTFRNVLMAASLLALPVAAHAQAVTGPYIDLGAGVNLMQNEHAALSTGVPGASGSTNVKTHAGAMAVVGVGYGFGNGLRAELEGNYRYNSLSGDTSGGVFGGHEQKFGGMVNALYDFVGIVPMVQPYVGVGAGYEGVQEQNLHFTEAGLNWASPKSTKGKFAYQAIIGAAVPIAATPGLAVTAEYPSWVWPVPATTLPMWSHRAIPAAAL
jgi:opacity protein-like surface antigen